MRRSDRDEYATSRGDDLPPPHPLVARARAILVVVVITLVFAEVVGVPHLRVTYTYRGPRSNPTYLTAQYWSVTGPHDKVSGDLPLIAVFPLEVPLRERARRAIGTALNWAQKTLGE